MDLQGSKIALAKLILNIENPDVITKIIDFVKGKEKDFWFELTPEQQSEIKIAMAQLNRGEKISWDELQDKVA